MNKSILILSLFLFVVQVSYSQFDSSYVHITKDKFSIYPLTELHASRYHIRFNEDVSDADNVDANYDTQNSIYLGFGMSFFRFGFALSFKLPYSNIPELKESKAFSFSGGYSYKKFYGELKLKNYKGLQQETVNYTEDTTITSINIIEDVETKQTGIMLYYIASEKYNFDANFKNYNSQRKSAISFIAGGGYNYYSFLGKLDITENTSSEFLNLKNSTQVHALRLMPGIAGSLVYHNFYFSVFSLLGAAYNYNILDNSAIRHNIAPTFEVRAALGYNNKNVFCSINFNYDYDLVRLRENRLGVNNYMVNFKFGIKLNSKYLGKVGHYL